MTKLTEEVKQQINKQYEEWKPLINKYAKTEPEIRYNYFDGNFLEVSWQNEKALVEFWFYRGGTDFRAFRSDDSEWMEIDDGGYGRSSCIERFGKREYVENILKEEYIKEGFSWLYE